MLLKGDCLIYQNVVDLTQVLNQLKAEGLPFNREDVQALSPYLTAHVRRFGDYSLDITQLPPSLEGKMELALETEPPPSSNPPAIKA